MKYFQNFLSISYFMSYPENTDGFALCISWVVEKSLCSFLMQHPHLVNIDLHSQSLIRVGTTGGICRRKQSYPSIKGHNTNTVFKDHSEMSCFRFKFKKITTRLCYCSFVGGGDKGSFRKRRPFQVQL